MNYFVYKYNVFLVNNYELCEWETFFLRLWSSLITSEGCIRSQIFLRVLSVDTVPLFQKYFSIYDDKVTMCSFIEFVCVFAFFYNKDLIKCIFYIYSNVINFKDTK